MTFILIRLAPELTHFIVGPDYQSASQYLIWGALAESMRVVAGMYSMSAHARMNTKPLLLPNLISAMVSIGLIWVLIRDFGLHGVGFARFLASVVMVVMMHYVMFKAVEINLPSRIFLKSISMGLGFLLMIMVGRWLFGSPQSL